MPTRGATKLDKSELQERNDEINIGLHKSGILRYSGIRVSGPHNNSEAQLQKNANRFRISGLGHIRA